jgi:uncharacterized RDD family membrane protein YckC
MKNCPKCSLINPDTAQICDCGYNFQTQVQGNPIDDTGYLAADVLLVNGSTYKLASLDRRFIGQFLDALIGLVPLVLAFGLESGRHNNRVDMSIAVVIGGILFFSYFLFADGFKGQSVAKRILKMKVINIHTGIPCSLMCSFVRNIMGVLGFFDWIFIFFGNVPRRLGDMAAGTVVVMITKS